MAATPIPFCAAEITADWLTEALREGDYLGSGKVTGIEHQVIGEGVGFMGELCRLTPTYDGPAENSPVTMVVKLPTAFLPARGIGNAFRFYEREARFYKEVAPNVPLRVPVAYHASYDVAADRYVILLEEITGADVGDQLAGASLEQARVVLTNVARLHAKYWDSPELEAISWMPRFDDPMYDYMGPLWQGSWENFLSLQAPDYPRDEMRAVSARALEKMDESRKRFNNMHQSLAHTDFRMDNMFFGAPGSETPFAVIDWQLTLRSSPLVDVGYFLSQSLDPSLRRANEKELVALYHEALMANGVSGYNFDECWRDYRFCVLGMFVIPVVAATNLDMTNPRSVPLMRALSERSTAAILELDCVDLL